MNKRAFHIIGWILLVGIGVSWIGFGYSNWYLLFLPLASIFFTVSDDGIKTLKKLRKTPVLQVISIVVAFIISVGIVFGLIQLSNYLINDIFHLTGWIKTLSQVIAIIIFLYPVKFIFGTIVYRWIISCNS